MINFATDPKSGWNSPEQLSVREAGLGEFPKPPVDPDSRAQLPAGRGRFPVEPHLGTVGLINQSFRSYHWSVDAAMKHSRSNAVAMLLDPVVRQALNDRIRPAAQLSWHIEPEDETDPAQVKAAAKVTLAISKTWKLQEFFKTLHLAKWYGKYGVELVWDWSQYNPDLMYVKNWSPVSGDSLVPRWSTMDWGRLVNFAYEGETESYSLGRVHYYTPEERESVVFHVFDVEQPDYYDTLGAGAIRGLGLRNVAYWMWYYRQNLLALLMDYMERFATGVWKGYYDVSNPNGRQDLEQAVAAYKSKSLLSLPRLPNGQPIYDLEIMEVGSASPAILKDFINYLDGLIRSYILGHPMGEGAEVNIGGDVAALYDGAISTTTKSDAVSLAEDLTANWLPTLYRYNAAGVVPGKFVFDVDHPNADKLLGYAQVMQGLGWPLDLDHLASICGLPKASMDATVSTKVQSLSPTALESPPQGVPMAGNAPAPQQQVAQPTMTPQAPQELPA